MLEDLPSLCVHLVAERLAAGMRGGERVDLGLLSASREVHSLFAAPLYDALDRGCVAELDALRARFHAGVAWVAGVAGVAGGDEGEGGAADGGGPKLRLLLLRAACADAGMSVTGTKGDLSARLDARRREELLRRRELRAAAAELLAPGSPLRRPTDLRCAVRPRARAALRSLRQPAQVTAAQARARHPMGVDAASLPRMPHVRRVGVHRTSRVRAHVLERHGPGSLQDDPATALPDPAALLADLAARRFRAALEGSRRAEAAAMLAEAGVDGAEAVARSRVDASALERYAAGAVGAGAVRRLAKAVRRALAAQAVRSTQLDAELSALRVACEACEASDASEASDACEIRCIRARLERELPGSLSPLLDSFVLYGAYDVGAVRAQLERAAGRCRRRAELAAALAAHGGCEPRAGGHDARMCDEFVCGRGGDAAAVAAAVRETRFFEAETTYAAELGRLERLHAPRYANASIEGRRYVERRIDDEARRVAFGLWVGAFASERDARDCPALPASLRWSRSTASTDSTDSQRLRPRSGRRAHRRA